MRFPRASSMTGRVLLGFEDEGGGGGGPPLPPGGGGGGAGAPIDR